MPAKSKCIAFSPPPPPPPKKIIIKPYDFTEQIFLDFTEQAQKKRPNINPKQIPKGPTQTYP